MSSVFMVRLKVSVVGDLRISSGIEFLKKGAEELKDESQS